MVSSMGGAKYWDDVVKEPSGDQERHQEVIGFILKLTAGMESLMESLVTSLVMSSKAFSRSMTSSRGEASFEGLLLQR